jgi:hypothetical protein
MPSIGSSLGCALATEFWPCVAATAACVAVLAPEPAGPASLACAPEAPGLQPAPAEASAETTSARPSVAPRPHMFTRRLTAQALPRTCSGRKPERARPPRSSCAPSAAGAHQRSRDRVGCAAWNAPSSKNTTTSFARPPASSSAEEGSVDREVWRKAGEAGLALPVDGRGARRRGRRLLALGGGDGGAGARYESRLRDAAALGHGGALHPRVRQRRAEAALAAGLRSGELVTAIAMTEPGTGSDLAAHPDHGAQGRRPLRDQRRQDVHLERQLCDLCIVACEDGRPRPQPAPRHLALRGRGGHAWLHQGQEAREDGHGLAGHRRARLRGLPRAGRQPLGAKRARAS